MGWNLGIILQDCGVKSNQICQNKFRFFAKGSSWNEEYVEKAQKRVVMVATEEGFAFRGTQDKWLSLLRQQAVFSPFSLYCFIFSLSLYTHISIHTWQRNYHLSFISPLNFPPNFGKNPTQFLNFRSFLFFNFNHG